MVTSSSSPAPAIGNGVIARFFAEVLHTPLWPRWAEIIGQYEQRGATELVMACGRRGGKTTTTAGLAVHHAVAPDLSRHLRPAENRYVVGVATSLEQGRIWLGICRDFITGSEALRHLLVDETVDSLSLSNRVIIKALPCSARSVRGLAASMVVMDECAHFVDSESGPAAAQRIYRALTPSVAQFGADGRVVILSTPLFKSGLFYDMVQRAEAERDPDVMLVRATSAELNPTLDPAWLERQRQRDPELFAVEYDALFSDTISAYLDFAAIQACVSRGERERPPRAGVRYVFGLDPAFTGDAWGLVGACQVGDRVSVDLLRSWRGTRAQPVQHAAVLAEVAELARAYSAELVTDQYCSAPVVQGLNALGRSVRYEPWSNETKAGAFSLLKQLVNTRGISLPDHAGLLRELGALELRATPGGRVQIGAASGMHDDLATGLAAAVAALVRPARVRWGAW